MGCGMFNDKAMYDDARMAKLKELRKLMVEEEMLDMNGEIDSEKLQDALAEAGGEAEMPMDGSAEHEGAESKAMEASEGAEDDEEDPALVEARRKFFKPERKEKPSAGTAIMIALENAKPNMSQKKFKSGKA